MEEKVLVKSEQYEVKKAFKTMVIIGVVLSALLLLCFVAKYVVEYYDWAYSAYLDHQESGSCGWWYGDERKCPVCLAMGKHPSAIGYAVRCSIWSQECLIIFAPVLALTLIGGLIYLWLRSYELTVTNKRIYGKIAWGKRVDLPVDSVSATAMVPLFKGVSVSTSSGRISFLVIKNADEIYTVMNDLLIERQQEKANTTATTIISQQSDEADQLKKYKDLLDGGVISQEEFDAKKKQLLGL